MVVIFFIFTSLNSFAQHKIVPTDQFSVQGRVKKQLSVSLQDLDAYKKYTIDSVVITSHTLEKKHTLKRLKGALLKDILAKAEIEAATPKELSEFYIICVASDNYKVVFSWNEIFNSRSGETVYLLTEVDGKPASVSNDRIILISTSDLATGRRYVKGLQKIVIERVQ